MGNRDVCAVCACLLPPGESDKCVDTSRCDANRRAKYPNPDVKGRPSFESIYMRLAFLMAERSTCRRLQVGCVITSMDYRRVYAVGYNGNVSGGPNDCDKVGEAAVGSCGCVHAEANAIISCGVSRDVTKAVFVTDLPCVTCGKYFVQLGGVRRVYYQRDYRIKDSLEWLERAGIEAVMLDGGTHV